MAVEPKLIVEGAPRVGLPYGLSSVVNLRMDADPHWANNGVLWETLTCNPASGIGDLTDLCASPVSGIGLPYHFNEGVPEGTADPFVVYTSQSCGPIGRGSMALSDAQARATQQLLAREEARVEQAFWTGDLGNTPSLAGAVDLNTGGAVDAPTALGLLEEWLGAAYGSVGVIHMGRRAAPTFIQAYLLEASGGQMKTELGTPVAVGAGYPGSSPAGAAAAAGTAWVYATPAVFGYRSDIFLASNREGDLLDRGTNDLFGLAQRYYLLGFDPCGVAAVRVTLGCC